MRLLRRGGDGKERYARGPGSQWHKGKSSTAEAFVRTDVERHDGPLLVYHHIPKTAGTALRRLIRENLPPCERKARRAPRGANARPVLLDWYRDWYESFDAGERGRLCCVMSHSAGYVKPALDRPAAEVLLVREPVDRVLSHFHYTRRRRSNAAREDVPVESVYERYGGAPAPHGQDRFDGSNEYFNGQSRRLLRVSYDVSTLPFSDEPGPDADEWRERLFAIVDSAFCAGVQDRFPELAELLAGLLGWRAFVPFAKVNPKRPRTSELEPDVHATILAHNWLDAELHHRCTERLDALLGELVPASTRS